MTLSDFLNQWLNDVVAVERRQKTFVTYESALRLHVLPVLGTRDVESLGASDFQGVLAQMFRDKKSPALRKIVYAALSSAFSSREFNPMARVVKPKGASAKQQIGKNIYTPEQIKVFLAGAKGSRFETLFRVLFGTGMRIGEALSLHRDDLDLAAGTVTIRTTLTEINSKVVGRFDTKTVSSHRTVKLPAGNVEALALHLARLDSRGYRGPWVFPNKYGEAQQTYEVRAALDEIAESVGLPRAKVHSTRHSHASALLANGIDLPAVSSRLGHSSIGITMGTYSHALPSRDQKAAEAIEQALT